jgi:hypothetical protein
VLRYHNRRAAAKVAYTWSHVLDSQSDPLLGDFFNTAFASLQTGPGSNGRAAFSREFDPAADRGSADFDQRHNLVFLGWWDLPSKFLNGWTVSTLAAVRWISVQPGWGPPTSRPVRPVVNNRRPAESFGRGAATHANGRGTAAESAALDLLLPVCSAPWAGTFAGPVHRIYP